MSGDDDELAPPRDTFPTIPDFVLDVERPPEEEEEGPPPEPFLAPAAELRRSGDWECAIEAYEKALGSDEAAEGEAQAAVFASIGLVKRAQGKTREAEASFERALAASPVHLRAL